MSLIQGLSRGYATTKVDFFELRAECIDTAEHFFNQPLEEKSKPPFMYPLHEERGYRFLGHKESLLIRDPNLPQELKCFEILATRMHALSLSILGDIEKHLQLKENALTHLTHSHVWQDKKNQTTESVLRIFRYFVTPENVAQPPCDSHEDLGLITIILKSTSPALEVFNLEDFEWRQAESDLETNEALVLVGESLSSLTQQYFPACTHRVSKNEKERYSFVYQLRLRHQAEIDSYKLQSPLYPIKPVKPIKTTGKIFFEAIKSKRNSVNNSYFKENTMDKFVIVNDPSDINLSDQWVDLENLNGNKIVDYRGHQYRVITEKERKFSCLERLGRGFLGVLICISTLTIAYFQWDFVKGLFHKKAESIRFGVLKTDEIEKNELERDKLLSIYVKSIKGTQCEITVNTSDTIQTVKEMIEKTEGTPRDQIVLLWAGKSLLDGETLNALNVQNYTTFLMVQKLRGD